MDQHHRIVVRIQSGERDLDRGRQDLAIKLGDQQGPGWINVKSPRSKWITSNRGGEFFCVRNLKTLIDRIDAEGSEGCIEETDGIHDIDWNAEITCASLDQRYRLLSNAGMPGYREHHGPA